MKRFVLSLIFAITFSNAYGSFTGEWYGTGFLTNSHKDIPCDIYFILEQKKDVFNIHEGGYLCADYDVTYPSSQFLILENALFYKGQNVGTINNQEVSIEYEFEPGNWFFLYFKKNDDESIAYDEKWKVPGYYLHVQSSSLALQQQ